MTAATTAHAGRRASLCAAALAILAACTTAGVVAAFAQDQYFSAAAASYVILTAIALAWPQGIAVQVPVDLATAALLVEMDGLTGLALVPIVAGIIVTAELTAAGARMHMVVTRPARGEIRRALRLGVLGGAICAGVILVGTLPTPAGPLSLGFAATACVALAYTLTQPG